MNTLDDDLIRDLCSALDLLTVDISETAPQLRSAGVAAVMAGPPRRDRRRVLVLAAAIVALVASVTALVAIRRDDRAVGTDDTAVDLAPVVTLSAPRTAHPVPLTPEGWDPVEWGNLRLSLPPDMSPFNLGNGCTTDTSVGLRIVCGDESVRISTGATDVVTDQLVNGMRVSWTAGECVGCQTMLLAELDTKVSVQRRDDASANAILGTVGPSGSWRYGNEARPSPPADWKTVTFAGMSIRVPPHWPIQTVASDEAASCPRSVIANTVVLDSAAPSDCAYSPVLLAPTDGVRMYLSKPPYDDEPLWPQQVIASTEGATDDDPWVVLRVGYGVDPTIGLAILSSFSSLTVSSTTYDTADLATKPYFAIGDSVMLGAEPLLEAQGIDTVADSSNDAPNAIEQLQQENATNRISHGVVVQLGTNGPITRQEYELVLAEVSDVPRVVVLTLNGSHPWIADNNDVIRSLPQSHPNVVVLYWDEFATANAAHLSNDGVHLGDDVSKQLYTNLILHTLGLPYSESLPGSVHTDEAEYVLQTGDLPMVVARKFRVSFEDLLSINGWTVVDGHVPEFPPIGTTIKIPPGWTEPPPVTTHP